MTEEFRTLDTYEIIEDSPQPAGEQGVEGEAPIPQSFDLSKFVANEIGAKEGRILSGSPEEPIEYDLSELTPKQQVAILKDYYSKQNKSSESVNNEFTEDEMYVINTLREGKLEDLYNQLSTELGRNTTTSNPEYSDDQLIEWKIKSELPDLSDDELEMEVEQFNNSPLRDKRLESIKNQYNQTLEAQKQQLSFQEQQAQQQEQEQLRQEITSIAESTSDLFDFELDDDIKNAALSDLLENGEGSETPRLVEFLGTPEGLTQTAMLWRAMPEINSYVNSLHKEIDSLKSKQRTEPNNKTVFSTNDDNMYEEEFDMVPELKPI
jgi:hypothetical protein